MSDDNTETTDDAMPTFNYGDWVECKLNTNVFGIVVDWDAHFIKFYVQLAGSLDVEEFDGVTLRKIDVDDDYEEPTPYDPEKGGAEVINFTEAKALRANTKTKGVA